jgi:hypothetical protein
MSSVRRRGVLLVVLALVAAGCSADDEAGPRSSTTTTTTTTEPGEPPKVEVDPVPDHNLVAALTAEGPQPFAVSVELDAGDHHIEVPPSVAATSHRLPLAGMRADTDYTVRVSFEGEDGAPRWEPQELEFRTGSLPEDLPPIEVEVPGPDQVSPGLTLFNLLDLRGAGQAGTSVLPDRLGGTALMVDSEGEIVWYHQEPHQISDVRQLPNGNIIFIYNDLSAKEVDLFGEPVHEWVTNLGRSEEHAVDGFDRPLVGDGALPVDVDTFHHEYNPLPNGNHLTMSTELRDVGGFTDDVCSDDPSGFDGSYPIIGDVIVEFEPESGDIVHRWNLFDYFDPADPELIASLCGLANFVFPLNIYRPDTPRAIDWTHANAAIVDEERNAVIISVRHTDQVLALRWQDDDEGNSGDVLWRLGPEGDLELTEGDWNYHQHAPELQEDGSILLYDNGNGRPGVTPYSRAVQYEIDDEAGTATEVWEFRSTVNGQPAYAQFVGDADRMDNGNVLIVDGGLVGTIDGVSVQIVEVVPDDSPTGGTVAFRISVVGGVGWAVYRAERLPTLYPG